MMEAYNKDLPMGAEETRPVTFTAPASNTDEVLGVDGKTGNTFFNLSTINSIIRSWEDQLQAATPLYEYKLERDGYEIRTLYSQQLKVEIQGPVYPGFPLNLSPGQYQIRMTQPTTGTGLAARVLNLVFQKSLV